jgi:E3 ubiquitin-protein ligase HUWE1
MPLVLRTPEQFADLLFASPSVYRTLLKLTGPDGTAVPACLETFGKVKTALRAIVAHLAGRLSTIDARELLEALSVLTGLAGCPTFVEAFNELLSEPLLLTLYRPQFRTSHLLLSSAATLIGRLAKEPPKRVLHLVMWLILGGDRGLARGLLPFSKLSSVDQGMILPSLKLPVDRVLAHFVDREVGLESIDACVRFLPAMVRGRRASSLAVLQTLLKRYRPERAGLVTALFGLLAAEVKTPGAVAAVPEIPRPIYDQDPAFWSTVLSSRAVLCEIISANVKLLDTSFRVLMKFPFLLDFPLRFRCFQENHRAKRTTTQFRIAVRRASIVDDSFRALRSADNRVFYGDLGVVFEGEQGVDQGGVRKDWLTAVIAALFNPDFALFTTERVPSPASSVNKEHLNYFTFAGKMLGKAVFDGTAVDCHLPAFLYKEILGIPITIGDFEGDPSYASLQWILANDPAPLDMFFVADVEKLGQHLEVPLKPGGAQIRLTEANKAEFVSLLVRHRLIGQAEQQTKNFIKGFTSILPREELAVFAVNELDMIVCGVPTIEIKDLRAHCAYIPPLAKAHPLVLRFFAVIRHWGKEDLAKLLHFVTGSSQVPAGGFKSFVDEGKPFTLAPGGDADRLAVAHTCMNTLDLPAYTSDQLMNEKLRFSISECNTFGII